MSLIEAGFTILRRVVTDVFTSPFSLSIYLVLLCIIAWQYHRISHQSGNLSRSSWAASFKAALVSTIFGVAGGLIGSIVLLWAGVDLSRIAIIPLWIAALLLMIISPRLLCFAYAGGVIGLLNLATGYPNLSIPDLMALVAILHMIESLLIFLDGRFFPVPIYVKRGSRLCGGFHLQKFWPVFLVVAVPGMAVINAQPGDWQAVLGSSLAGTGMVCVLAVLGYGEVSTAFFPASKARRSGLRLFGFSAALLMLSILAAQGTFYAYSAVLFSPLGHEFIIWLGLREEKKHFPAFVRPHRGVMVLGADPGSPAAVCGLQAGDIITRIGDHEVNNDIELQAQLKAHPGRIDMDGLRQGRPAAWKIAPDSGLRRGIIPVPDHNQHRHVVIPDQSLFNIVEYLLTSARNLIKRCR